MIPEESLEKNVQESKKITLAIFNSYIFEVHIHRNVITGDIVAFCLLIKHNVYIINTARRKPHLPPTKEYVCVRRKLYPDG